jgi:hypothetical protein
MLNRVILFVTLLAAAMLPAAAANAERRVALVVGNSAYVNANALRNPRNDASDMAAELKKVGFDVLLGLDLDQQAFARLIEQYAQRLDGADVGLFYYAGHGLQINQKNYLVSVNAKLDNEFLVSSETIDLESVVRLMESKAPVNLIFVDACRNDPLADNLRRNLVAMKRSVDLGRGLARIEPSGRDTLVAYATAPGQEAADGRDRNSPFTGALLKHLPTPGLEVSVMLKEVAADVRRATHNEQRPQQLSDMSRTFYFVPAAQNVASAAAAPQQVELKAPPVPSMPGVDDRTLEIAFWNAAQASNQCEAMQAYLHRFPDGNFVALAKLAEHRLCDPQRHISVVSKPPAAGPPAASPDASTAAPGEAAPASVAPSSTVQTAAVPPAAAPAAAATTTESTDRDMIRDIQLELIRLGCNLRDVNGQWQAPTQSALKAFNAKVGLSLELERPEAATLEKLKHYPASACSSKPEAKPHRAERKPKHHHAKPRQEKAAHAPRRPSHPKRAEHEYRRPAMRERLYAPPRPPVARAQPQQEAPYVCIMDEGYGRTRRCDAGGR